MSQAAAQSVGHARGLGLTASALRTQARALHQSRVIPWNVGWVCVLAAGCLSALGVSAISTTAPGEAARQLVFLGVSVVAAIIVALPHYRWALRISFPLMGVVLFLLVFVMVPFVPESLVHPRNGARRWISLGLTDFQPSELAKIAYVLCLAGYLRFRDNYRRLRGLLMLLALTFIPMGLILIEPDLGTSLLFLPTLFAMVIAAGAKLRHIVLIIALGLAAAPAMYPFLQQHQKDRIMALVAQIEGDPRYEKGIGFQAARAMTLTGAGGWVGVGKERAADLVEYNRLPEDHNDMVFALVCCRWGLLGALMTWGLFGLLCGGGVLTAALCKDPFGRLVAVGVVCLLFTQMTINTGMTLGVLPITGITLPFVSYGGSSLVTTWLMVGLLLNIAMRRSKRLARRSFEFDAPPTE